MKKLIDKDALVAEIDRKINEINLDVIEDWRYRLQQEHDIEVMKNIISLIDTLEVKEVDLKKEAERFVQTKEFAECEGSPVMVLAKHFFALGLKAKQG